MTRSFTILLDDSICAENVSPSRFSPSIEYQFPCMPPAMLLCPMAAMFLSDRERCSPELAKALSMLKPARVARIRTSMSEQFFFCTIRLARQGRSRPVLRLSNLSVLAGRRLLAGMRALADCDRQGTPCAKLCVQGNSQA